MQLPVLGVGIAPEAVCTSRGSRQRRGSSRSRHPDGIVFRRSRRGQVYPAGRVPAAREVFSMGYTGSHPRNRLTDLAVRQALPGRHADGHGLHLLVRPSGTRSWMQRLVVLDKRRDMGLGAYPLVSLADARKVAFQNRQQARSGGNPFTNRAARAVPTLRQLAQSAIEDRRGTWRGAATERGWITPRVEKYVFPTLGDVRIDQVTLDAVVAVLRPHWRGRGSAGYLLRQRLDVSAVARKSVILDGTSTTTCRGCMSEHGVWGAMERKVRLATAVSGVSERPELAPSDRFRCGERVASQQVDVLVAER